jgi:hypothetical protein
MLGGKFTHFEGIKHRVLKTIKERAFRIVTERKTMQYSFFFFILLRPKPSLFTTLTREAGFYLLQTVASMPIRPEK